MRFVVRLTFLRVCQNICAQQFSILYLFDCVVLVAHTNTQLFTYNYRVSQTKSQMFELCWTKATQTWGVVGWTKYYRKRCLEHRNVTQQHQHSNTKQMKTHSHNQKINNCTADLVIIDDDAADGFVIVLEANFSFALSNSLSHSLFRATDLLVQFRCDKSLCSLFDLIVLVRKSTLLIERIIKTSSFCMFLL